MDCERTRELLAAYHDGELAPDERARVGDHLRGCGECSAVLDRLARVDANVDVPDPGADYWERFNRRVMERVDRAAVPAEAPPRERWWRRRLPYFVPAAAAAALLLVVVRQMGIDPLSRTPAPTAPVAPPQVSAQAPRRESSPSRPDRPAPQGYPYAAGASPGAGAPPPAAERAVSGAANGAPSPVEAERAGVARNEAKGRAAAGGGEMPPPVPAPSQEMSRQDAAPTRLGAMRKEKAAPAEREENVLSEGGASRAVPKSMTSAAPAAVPAPCREARALADRGRLEEAEAAQRACLAREISPETQEAGMVFLAELLDRQSRFSDADAVLEETRRRFPASRPLDAYLRQRSRPQDRR